MKTENVEKLVANLRDKICYAHKNHRLNHRLVLKKVLNVIKLNQNAWLKPYIDINTHLRKKANDFEKDFLS